MGIISLEVGGIRTLLLNYCDMQSSLNSRLLLSSFDWRSSNKHIRWHGKSLYSRLLQNSVETLNYDVKKSYCARLPTFIANNDLWFDCTTLDSLPRRKLQHLCKKFGIRAVSKTEKLIQDLKEFHRENLSNPSSVLHSPFISGSTLSLNNYKKLESSLNRSIDKSSGIFTPLGVSASSILRDEELQRLCKTVGARKTSSRSTAISLNSLKTNLGELDKSFRILADTRDKRELFLDNKPSVSTILNCGNNKSKAFIISKWRKKKIDEMGEEAFKKYQKDIVQKGKNFHSYIMDYFSGSHYSVIDGIQGYVQSVSSMLNDISCVIATEKRVSHYHLGYSGFLDTLALYKGIPCLIEWKTSEKPKQSLEDCHDFPLQVAAYAGAINSSPYFSVPVTNGLVVIAYHDGTPAHVHKMNMQTCDFYWQQWLIRVHKYKQSL